MSLDLRSIWFGTILNGPSITAKKIGATGLWVRCQEIYSTSSIYHMLLSSAEVCWLHQSAKVWILDPRDVTSTVLDLVKNEIIELLVHLLILPSSMLQSINVRRSRMNMAISDRENDMMLYPGSNQEYLLRSQDISQKMMLTTWPTTPYLYPAMQHYNYSTFDPTKNCVMMEITKRLVIGDCPLGCPQR